MNRDPNQSRNLFPRRARGVVIGAAAVYVAIATQEASASDPANTSAYAQYEQSELGSPNLTLASDEKPSFGVPQSGKQGNGGGNGNSDSNGGGNESPRGQGQQQQPRQQAPTEKPVNFQIPSVSRSAPAAPVAFIPQVPRTRDGQPVAPEPMPGGQQLPPAMPVQGPVPGQLPGEHPSSAPPEEPEDPEEPEQPAAIPPPAAAPAPMPSGFENIADPEAQRDAVYNSHAERINGMQVEMMGAHHSALDQFVRHYQENRARYAAIADRTDIPAPLVAALHWRESTGNFGAYMHNGDPLGTPTTHVPAGKLFHNFEDSAVDALGDKSYLRDRFSLSRDSQDLAGMASYAEYYNGPGYHNRNVPSPYVYSGTNRYDSGKYIADGVYDPSVQDKQIGVLLMISAVRNM
jgi:lysozyme family protein